MENKEKVLKDFKVETLNLIHKLTAKTGGLPPVIVVLVKNLKKAEDKGKTGAIVCPIPPEYFDNEESKHELAQKILPKVFKELENQGLELLCCSWSSEAWVRKVDKKQEIEGNWRDLPKKEAIVTIFETAEGDSNVEIHYMHREGKISDENGELIDCIRLEKQESDDEDTSSKTSGGIFSNVFSNYLKNK